MIRITMALVCVVAGCQPVPSEPDAATSSIAQAASCDPTDVYSAASQVKHAPHEFFCGSVRKSAYGDSPPGDCGSLPQPTTCCMSQEKVKDPSGNGIPVTERVEVRGWIHELGGDDHRFTDKGDYQHEQEYNFQLRLDLDWDASPCLPPNVTPINSLARYAKAITPYNELDFFDTPESATISGGGWVQGSHVIDRNPRIKVEIDGWDEHGGRMDKPCSGMTSCFPSELITGWVNASGFDANPIVLWPFNPDSPPTETGEMPDALAEGDYVRIVGTLWEDAHHDATTGPASCWNNGTTAKRGWKEIHPVDYMARLKKDASTPNLPPHPSRAYSGSQYAYLALCDTVSVTNWKIPAPPRPSLNDVMRFEVVTPDGFTTQSHENPPLWMRVVDNGHIAVDVGVENWHVWFEEHNGRFYGLFRVWWEQCTPKTVAQACGGATCGTAEDGCGHTLSCGTCGAGTSCRAGRCCTDCPVLEIGDACGTAFSTCGNCTACTGGSTCTNGRCACRAGYKNCYGDCILSTRPCIPP